MATFEAERRLVTVLYADLVGHTEVATRIDPEEWRALLQAYFAEMTQPIQRYGGRVEKFIGDAIFAVFGVPRSHEDDAERAVRAAVAMQAGLSRLNLGLQRRLGAPLELRIGIATGEAVAPTDAQEDRLITGELTSLAERLQAHAPTNGIVLSQRTYRLVAPLVEAEPLGGLDLKGFPGPQQAFSLRRITPTSRKPLGIGVAAPLVGRERELAQLEGARDRLLAGHGQLVVIIGEAGLGKSRLVAELRASLGAGTTFIEARCQEFTQGISYGIVAQHLRAYLGVAEADPAEVVRLQLGSNLYRAFGTPTPEMRPVLERLLGLAASHEFEEGVRGLAPEQIRHEVTRAISAFWETATATAPLVLMVEDLHWVDSASAGVVSELVQITERAPLMLVCTFRPERRSLAWDLRVAAERDYPHRYHEIRLEPLSRDETEHLAEALLKGLALPVELKVTVAQRAEGNPFYVEEVVRSLQLQGPERAKLRPLPDTLQGVLQARLDELPRSTRRVVQIASVIGRTFPLRLLRTLAGANGDLGSHLSTLQRTGFILEQERRPEPRFAFKHVLTQEAAYNTLLREERRQVHRRLAEALEQESPVGPTLPLLAYHFAQGEAWGKAFAYSVQAADAARSLAALKDALQHYDSALSIARDHPESGPDQSLLLHAQIARGDILSFLGRYQEAQRHFEELLGQYRAPGVKAKIYRGLGRLNSFMGNLRQAQTNLEEALRLHAEDRDPAQEAETYQHLAGVMERRRDYAKALEYAHRALAIAEEHALRIQVREIYTILTRTHFFGGDIEQALSYAEEALRVGLQGNDQLGIVQSRNNLANLLLFQGNIHEGLRQAEEAVALATKLDLGVPLVVVHSTLARIFLEQGRWKDAADNLTTSEGVVRRHALAAHWQAVVHREQGFISLAEGLWDEAIGRLEAAKSLEERGGFASNLPRIHRGLAEAYLGLEDRRQARAYALEVKVLERGGNPIESPGALRVLAVIAREEGDLQGAIALLEETRGLLDMRRSSGEYARTLLELARTYAKAGRTVEARAAAKESITVCAALEAVPLLDAARQVAAQL